MGPQHVLLAVDARTTRKLSRKRESGESIAEMDESESRGRSVKHFGWGGGVDKEHPVVPSVVQRADPSYLCIRFTTISSKQMFVPLQNIFR